MDNTFLSLIAVDNVFKFVHEVQALFHRLGFKSGRIDVKVDKQTCLPHTISASHREVNFKLAVYIAVSKSGLVVSTNSFGGDDFFSCHVVELMFNECTLEDEYYNNLRTTAIVELDEVISDYLTMVQSK